MSVAEEIPVDRIDARRIGLVADTHSANADGSDLPDIVLDALRGVDAIVHLGDMGAVGALDRFATVAPVLATRGGHAVGEDPRIARVARVIEAGGCTIGALFDLAQAHSGFTVTDSLAFPDGPLAPALTAIFRRRVDVVAYAATHCSYVARRDGVLFVNPGSPNLPSDGPGTVAILDLSGAEPAVEIRDVRG
jgi:hypothetical protein